MIRNAGRIDHVAGLVRPENFASTVARMTEVLGIAFYGPIDREGTGLRVAGSLDGGIEIIAPLSDDPASPLNALLAARGEHWMSVVFGVADLDATCDHLARMGYTPVRRGSSLQPGDPHAAQIARMEQASFAPELFHGLPFVFSCAEGRDDG
jgi:hypothetical protein